MNMLIIKSKILYQIAFKTGSIICQDKKRLIFEFFSCIEIVSYDNWCDLKKIRKLVISSETRSLSNVTCWESRISPVGQNDTWTRSDILQSRHHYSSLLKRGIVKWANNWTIKPNQRTAWRWNPSLVIKENILSCPNHYIKIDIPKRKKLPLIIMNWQEISLEKETVISNW